MENPFSVFDGVLWHNLAGPVRRPCVLLDVQDGVLLRVGDRERVEPVFRAALCLCGPNPTTGAVGESFVAYPEGSDFVGIVMVDLADEGVGAEEACVLVNHLLTHTGSEFVQDFGDAFENRESLSGFIRERLGGQGLKP